MSCLRRWKHWIRPLLISLYFIFMIIALPLTVWELNEKGAKSYVQAWFIGGLFVMMALPISLWGILQHLVNYTQPDLQRHIIRILWMVPIYALNAWFALRFSDAAIYLDTLRECYEAYVIYNFMSYLLRYLDIEYPHLDIVLENKPQQKHLIPFCCFPPWPMGPHFIQRCKFGVLQYTVIRPSTTIVALICQFADVYDEGEFNFTSAWSYLVIINNISQVWALYCLVLFYKGTRDELKPLNPVPKFLCVKAVVFLSFWQAVFISILVAVGWIDDGKTWVFGVKQTARGLQDFCICIEMFLAAIAHYYSFSYKPYMDLAAEQRGFWASFVAMWDVSDVRDDVFEHVRVIGKKVKGTVGNHSSSESERTPLLRDSKQPALNIQDSVVVTPESVISPQHTPPEHITAADVHRTFSPLPRDDARGSISDWDFSGDHSNGYNRSDITASLNNYAKFNDSVDFEASGSTKSYPPKLNDHSDIRDDTDKSSDLLQCAAEPLNTSDLSNHSVNEKVSYDNMLQQDRNRKSSQDARKLTATDILNSDSLLTNGTSSDISLLSEPEYHNVSVSASMNNYAAFSTSEDESKPKEQTQLATDSSDISLLSESSQNTSISRSMNNDAVFSTSPEDDGGIKASLLKSTTTLAAKQSSSSRNESNGGNQGHHKQSQHSFDHNENNPIV